MAHHMDITSAGHDLRASPEDRFDRACFEADDTGRSNFLAFMLGGAMIATGTLGFLYYEASTISRDDITTGSVRTDTSTSKLRLPGQPAVSPR